MPFSATIRNVAYSQRDQRNKRFTCPGIFAAALQQVGRLPEQMEKYNKKNYRNRLTRLPLQPQTQEIVSFSFISPSLSDVHP